MYKLYVKRVIDFLFSLVGLMFLSPILIVIGICLLIVNRGSPFFLQRRPGKDGRIFKIIKFKTMNDRKDDTGVLLSDQDRLTKFGLFVRATSLDEIPQLLNVLKGDMSLIGPRPLLEEYLPLYDLVQKRRHEVKPGITGWAQVNGRNAISWHDKFTYDVWYVDNLSFSLDLKIISMTIKKVLIKEGVSSKTSVTMEKFTGN
ncbi:lipid carrier--UDP-N-acetylgalactosaminyltransferase [Pedobacter yulinensis]|uniref:Lipid carrier--UDP-N-acetylgalactosaminyltransferase n=1 Tax=Pedobacter yulinensis TaxID=2126353 RepID=A0A2T3HNN2_9SPHI|nr:lipid carrier--UDP-N-acetylgalactosaminyltransferase [Pedobacter yulinensis]